MIDVIHLGREETVALVSLVASYSILSKLSRLHCHTGGLVDGGGLFLVQMLNIDIAVVEVCGHSSGWISEMKILPESYHEIKRSIL